MSRKVAIKTPRKASAAAATLGKKADGLTLNYKKIFNLADLKQKPSLKPRKWSEIESAVAPSAGHKAPRVEREKNLAGELIAEIAENSADVNEMCKTYELKREELGRLTGFSLRALAEWAAGSLPSQPAKRRLHEVRRLLDALAQIVKRESIPIWLHKRNVAFGNLTPLQVIEFGEMDRLWAMVHDMGSGQPE